MKKAALLVMAPVLCVLFQSSINAEVVIIDFEELSSLGNPWGSLNSQEYITQGFKLTTDADSFKYATFYGESHIGLSVGENSGSVQLQRMDESLFDVQKISFLSDAVQNITLFGEKSDSTYIQYDISTLDNWQITEYILPNFDDLVSLSWDCNPELYFDNIVTIPEPTSSFLFIFGTILSVRNSS